MGMNRYSSRITQPRSQGASQAMLYATGLTEADMDKPQVGIASVWYEGNSCNMHLLDLAEKVKEGVEDAGLIGFRFNTVGVSDGISMGTRGMSYSLQSRDLIADSIETVTCGQWYDANVSIPGCDKNMPGVMMAIGRMNRPALMVYGGTIRAGRISGDKPIDIVNAFQSYGQYLAGSIDESERFEIVRKACPGAGACGGMYTANTMASAIEAMGMSLPYSSSIPAVDAEKLDECYRVGAAVHNLLEKDLKPRDIMTREAFENAMVVVMALGGSTNAVLHLIAMARAVEVPLSVDDFQAVSNRIPYIADLKPSGQYVMEDVHRIGGTPAIMKYLLQEGLITGDCMTVTGRTVAENLAGSPDLAEGQPIIHPLAEPINPRGHIRILRGNLAPGSAVAKITGQGGAVLLGPRPGLRFRGGHAGRPRGKPDREGRRHRDPVRGAQGRARDAGDADPDLGDHGRGTRFRRRAHHRRALLRRLARIHHWPRRSGSPGRGADRPRRGRGRDHHRRAREPPRRGRERRRTPATPGRVVDAVVQGLAGYPVQVHQDRQGCVGRVRYRRLSRPVSRGDR